MRLESIKLTGEIKTLLIMFLPTVSATRLWYEAKALQHVQFQLSCELSHRHGKTVLPNMLAKTHYNQQEHGQEAGESETGASGALQNKRRTILTYEQMGKVTIIALTGVWETAEDCAACQSCYRPAGCGGIPFYMTDSGETTKKTVRMISLESIK